ncbi:YdcF family protein [Myxococcota bacterium]|nr:YdcF family protein [Myxococcota bacterium]
MLALDYTFVAAAGAAFVAVVAGHGARRPRLVRRAAALLAVLAAASIPLYRDDLAMQKLPGVLVMPVGLVWLGLLALGVHLVARGLRAQGAAALALFTFLSLAACPAVSTALMRVLESEHPEFDVGDTSKNFDAVLVLGGGATFRNDGAPMLTDQGDRIAFAARLVRHGRTKVLVASGSTIGGFGDVLDLSVAAERMWIELGVPPDVIRRSPEPKNTTEELVAFRAMAAREGWTKLGVSSSAWHLPRAMRLARRLGLDVTPIPSDHRGGRASAHPAALVPQAGALRTTQLALWELVGMAVGR